MPDMLTGEQEREAPAAPRQVNVDLGRASLREGPSAGGTPQKRSLRKTASALSPRKNPGKSAQALRINGACFVSKRLNFWSNSLCTIS